MHIKRTIRGLLLTTILPLAAEAQAQYGSLAFDEDTYKLGFRVNSSSAADAEAGALYWCRNAGGTRCKISMTFSGSSCLTLSVSENRRYWYRLGDQGTRSQEVALGIEDGLTRCTAAGGFRCAPQRVLCADLSDPWVSPSQPAVSSAVVAFAQSQLGSQYGDGECWTLVDAALAAANALRPHTSGLDTYVFGLEVYGGYQAGDVVQFESVRLQTPTHWDDLPQHTAIITAARGSVIDVLQQNVNGDRHVQAGTYDLGTVVSGRVRVYRPIPRL